MFIDHLTCRTGAKDVAWCFGTEKETQYYHGYDAAINNKFANLCTGQYLLQTSIKLQS